MIKFEGNILYLDKESKKFEYQIKDTVELDKMIIVLLEIPYDDKTIDNIYALSRAGDIIWRSESIEKLYPKELHLPYEYIAIDGKYLKATDFYGRRYFLDIDNGSIQKRDIVK